MSDSAASLPEVHLRVNRASMHLWIYAKMIRRPDRPIKPGTLVRVRNKDGTVSGVGVYNPASTIAIRLLSTRDVATGPDLFASRLAAAKDLRERVLRLGDDSDAYRLVHGEVDGLPGLIIDRYGDHLLVKPYTSGYRRPVMDWVVDGLTALYPGCRVHVAPDEKGCAKDAVDYAAEARHWPVKGAGTTIRENGLRFHVDLAGGHKTGYFLDQKLNRRLAGEISRDADVLDLYCYTGGFGIHCCRGGARSVTAVDLDPTALEVGRRNAKLNGVEIDFHQQDVFTYLRESLIAQRQYDLVIADPAKLAAVKGELSRALRTFGDLNQLAMRCVRPGGLLFTFSCTGLVSDKVFQSVVFNSAQDAHAVLRVLYRVGPSPDHPYSSIFPEARYLNGLLCQVLPA